MIIQKNNIKCSTSQAKHRLFIGNVPRNWTEEDLRKAVTGIGPGVNSVELLKVCDIFYIVFHISSCYDVLCSAIFKLLLSLSLLIKPV